MASTSAASTTGVYLHCWGCAYQDACVLEGGIHYRGCTFITGGVASTSAASTTGGVPSLLGVWHTPVLHPLQGVYLKNWGGGIHQCCIHYRGCTFIAGGVHTRTHVYWKVASTTGGVPS